LNPVSLAKRVAVVTGGGSGVGRAIALQLAGCGSNVHILGRRIANLEETLSLAKQFSGSLIPHAIDIADEAQVLKFRDLIARDTSEIAVLVHSAGIFARGPVASAPVVELDRQYQANLRGPWLLTQSLLPMIKSATGQIVFINSSAGLTAGANVGQYAATKHGLRALAGSLREEVNTLGIRVLTIYLGRTATPMQAAVHQLEGKQYRAESLIQPSDVASVVLNALTLPRTAEVTDVTMRPMIKG
jgi:NADP-dependent 3-hydroxy acid dehydrogenase YdfG